MGHINLSKNGVSVVGEPGRNMCEHPQSQVVKEEEEEMLEGSQEVLEGGVAVWQLEREDMIGRVG